MFPVTTSLRYGLAVATAVGLSAALPSARAQTTLPDRLVTSAADDGVGTLREAVRMSHDDGRAIRFASGIGDLTLASPLTLSRTTRISGASDGSTFLQGAGLRLTGDGNDTLYLTGVTFRNNVATAGAALYIEDGAAAVAIGVDFVNNTATGDAADQGGGAVYNAGYFYAEDVVFDHNRASGTSGSGGAIFSEGDARLQVVRSRFVGNTANRAGGAVEIAGEDDDDSTAAATFFAVDFTGNQAQFNPGNGGALHITGSADVDVFGGTASTNKAGREGGAFWNDTGRLYLDGVTATDNVASGNEATQGGGAVFNDGGLLLVVNGTYSDNDAVGSAGSGGAIFNAPGGTVEVYGTRFSANTATRAGGGIEDNSGEGLGIQLFDVTAEDNTTGGNPGNGGFLHITGPGDADLHGGTFSGNVAAAEGGALWNGTGTMNVRGSMIMGNVASGPTPTNGGGGIYNNGGTLDIDGGAVLADNLTSDDNGAGGAIFNATGGKLRIANSTLRDNTSNGVGGAIEDDSGASTTTEIYNTVMSGNSTLDLPGCGGAIHFKGMSNGLVVDSEVTDNRGTEGGGLWNGAGTLVVRNTNVLRNVAFGDSPTHQGGGGLYNGEGRMEVYTSTIADNSSEGSDAYGGGIKQDTKGKTLVYFSTITGNTSAYRGGAIGSKWMAEVSSSTLARNTAAADGGAVALNVGGFDTPTRNTIFVENEAGGRGDNFFTVTGARVVSRGNNLLDAVDGDFYRGAPSDVILGDGETALLGELADNGGPTLTLLPDCESPARGAGDEVFGPDQTGGRGDGTGRAIGAVEPQDCEDELRTPKTEAPAAVSLHVYPTLLNGGDLTVEFASDAAQATTSTDDVRTVTVTDARGRTMGTYQLRGERATVPVANLDAGAYFVTETTAAGVRTARFSVSR